MADTQEPKTISLAEFATRVREGEAVEQELVDGTRIALQVFTPNQKDITEIQKIWNRIARAVSAMANDQDIDEEDAVQVHVLGLECLRACLRDENGGVIDDMVFVELFSKLPYKSPLMKKCQSLCGVTLIDIPPFDNRAMIEAMKAEVEKAVEAAEDG